MPIFNYFCPKCEETVELYCKEVDNHVQCGCGEVMSKCIPKVAFVVNGANEKNGYTTKKES